nr:YihY/virulence factor BrkB family protein [Bacteriovorax sp. HI3]
MSTKQHLKKFIEDVDKHDIFTLSGSLAYTTALALAPFVLILLSLASILTPDVQEKIYLQLASSIGEKAGQTVIDIVQNAKKNSSFSGISGIIGFIILLISASAIFIQLRVALNKINDHDTAKDKTGFWFFIKDRFLSMGLVFGFAFLSIVSLIASTAISVVFQGGEGLFWQGVSLLINLIIFSVLFTAIFKVVPSDKLDWRRSRISGIVSAVFYLIGKNLISLYLAHAGLESSYGAAGSLVAFLVWVYYSSLTLLISYEFTRNIVLYQDVPDKFLSPKEKTA